MTWASIGIYFGTALIALFFGFIIWCDPNDYIPNQGAAGFMLGIIIAALAFVFALLAGGAVRLTLAG